MVAAFWVVAKTISGEGQFSSIDFMIFDMGCFAAVGWLSLLASTDTLKALLGRLERAAGAVQASAAGEQSDPGGGEHGLLACALTNLWVPVTFLFLLATWLVYASGGLANSPFISLPVTMMIVGQSVYCVPAIRLPAKPRSRDLLIFVGCVLRFYWYPQLLFASMLVALALLQRYHPLRTSPAPTAETMLATQLNLSIGMCVAFLARRFDRTATANTD